MVAGCMALAVGIMVYLTDRVASRPPLLPGVDALAGLQLFGVFGRWLPSFVHPLAFSLFSATALPARSLPRYGVCLAWCAVSVAFEIGQHTQVRQPLAHALQAAFGDSAVPRAVANYFLHGTFDPGDIVAAVLGAVAAATVLRLMRRSLEGNHAN